MEVLKEEFIFSRSVGAIYIGYEAQIGRANMLEIGSQDSKKGKRKGSKEWQYLLMLLSILG